MTYVKLNEIESVIFDFDGLLVNSEDIITECWKYTCKHLAIDVPETFFDNIVGVSKDVTFKKLQELCTVSVTKEEFFEIRARFIDEEVENNKIHLLPGVQKCIEILHQRKIDMYVATSSSRTWPDRILKRLNMRQYIQKIYGNEDVENVKPYPDLYNLVVDKNHLDKQKTLIFEDSEAGVIAATRAKIKCVIVNKRGRSFHSDINEPYVLSYIESFNDMLF